MQTIDANVQHLGKLWGRVMAALPACVADGVEVPVQVSALEDGLLPMWIAEGEALWGFITGQQAKGMVMEDGGALLGVRQVLLPKIPTSALIACMTHAAVSLTGPEQKMVLDPAIIRFREEQSGPAPATTLSINRLRM